MLGGSADTLGCTPALPMDARARPMSACKWWRTLDAAASGWCLHLEAAGAAAAAMAVIISVFSKKTSIGTKKASVNPLYAFSM